MILSKTSNQKNQGRKSAVKKNQKRFEEHKQSLPAQLTLFQFLEETDALTQPRRDKDKAQFSQSVELYDFIPKYVWGKIRREDNGMLKILIREFECRDVKRKVHIHPAGIVDENGVARYFYPGAREEIVEEVLRKLTVERGGVFLDDQSGLAFSIYQIRKELEEHNHRMSYDQVLESLKILALTRLEVINVNDKKDTIIFSPIENLGLSGRDGETQTFVVFSPLVTESIKKLNFRLYNYKQVMSYKSAIARQLHKRMAHHFKQASITQQYKIYLSTIIRDFGLTQQSSMRTNLIDVDRALKEMRTAKVILAYKCDKVLDPKRRNKIVDVMISIQPSPEFSAEVMKANRLESDNRKRLAAGSSAS